MVDFDLRRLRVLRELSERGTLAAVAVALGYSPSAVSQQLAELAREAGVRLLEPAGRGVRLTHAGRLLAHHAAVLLAAADTARTELANLADEVSGTVRAVGLQSATRRLLIPAMVSAGQTNPSVHVNIAELELEVALPELRLGTVDVVISDEYDGLPRPRPDRLHRQLLLRERTRVVLPTNHALARSGGPVPLAELRDAAWTSSNLGTGHHAMVVATCRSLGGFDPHIRHHSNDADVQLELVRVGAAVGLLPELTLPDHADPALAVRDAAGHALERQLHILTRAEAHSPAQRAFITALDQKARQLYRLQTI